MRIIENYFILFMIYSFIGWVWESVFCSLWSRGNLINRGFLNGPYCAVYGFGAILVIVLLSKVKNVALLFTLSAFLTCTLEYITSVAMEKMFNARWWDYSDMKFNIKGRVCLLGFLIFGAFSILLVRFINPAVTALLERIEPPVLNAAAAWLFVIFITDVITTLKEFGSFNIKPT